MPRITRVNAGEAKSGYTWNYREALPLLLKDFGQRCAYSLVHKDTIGDGQMHVDHFDPRTKRASKYSDLYPAYQLCNMAKGAVWPVASQLRAGMRFLDPCKEDDYDTQIFEDPNTNELVAADGNAAAEFHIDVLDLNNRNLVLMRQERSTKQKILSLGLLSKSPEGRNVEATLIANLKVAIPPILPPP